MSSSENAYPPERDIVALYHKHKSGTFDAVPSKKWLDQLEEQIVTFLGKLFNVKRFDKPLKSKTKSFETCVNQSGTTVKDTNILLYSIATLVNLLPEKLLCDVLPLMANLIFLSKRDFTRVKTRDAKKLVLKLQEMFTSPAYLVSDNPTIRLRKLMEKIDTMRKYSEYLLRISGYSLSMGRSPRSILRDIQYVRSNSTL